MKTKNKKNLLYIILTIIVSLLIILTISIYNSTNYLQEEISTIEYLRSLYYNNFNLIPDFATNLKNGISTYNLIEYGFLSPIVLLSYLFPFLSIKVYLNIISLILLIIISILVYNFYNRKKTNKEINLLLSIITITLPIIVYNTYYNPLLLGYLVFLILSFYGIDKVLDNKKSYLLIISVFLMYLSSPIYSISGTISLIIYTIYRYLKKMNTITIKSLLKHFISIIVPIIIGILCSSILTLPTLLTLYKKISIIDLLPKKQIIIPIILIPSIINYFKKDKVNITINILTIIVLLLTINNHHTISFIPLYLIIIENFLLNIITKKLNIKPLLIGTISIIVIYLIIMPSNIIQLIDLILIIISITIYYVTSSKTILITLLSLTMLINTYLINTPKKDYINNIETTTIKEQINYITNKDKSFYRISNYENNLYLYNNINYNSSSLYNENNPNILTLLLTNNKYIITKSNPPEGYELISSTKEYNIYKNDNVLPLGFATSNIMSYEDYNKLPKYTKQEALLNVIVADQESKSNFVSNIKKTDLDYQEILNNENITHTKDNIIINTKETLKVTYELPDKYKNKIIFINFKVKTTNNKTIKINNIYNKTDNKNLEYILAEKYQDKLVFTFEKGQYIISDIETYILDYATIENNTEKLDHLIIDTLNTKGDKIIGTIDIKEDSYFMITIPYNSGFNILLDNQQIPYEKVDDKYIGFPITEGIHSIEIEYLSPGKKAAYLLSILGVISTITVTYLEFKRKFQ